MAKKVQLSYKEIEGRLQSLKTGIVSADEIGYHLLYAFGKGEREIARFKEGKGVIKTYDGLLIKGLFCYRGTTTLRLASELEDMKRDAQVLKAAPKILAVSDGKTIRAFDLRQRETFEQQVARLYCDFEFFYPLAGVERIEYVEESPADIKAAEKLAKLHDEIRAYNEFTSDTDLHDLNTFMARLLFCFFAEDTGIFADNVFTDAIKKFTVDARNLKDVLEQLFRFMGGKPIPAGMLQTYCQHHFAYVGGGLFERSIYIPNLSNKARQIIIESGELDWQNINPDIFGSMIQAVVNPDVRANQGMHYTSVPNIMKVINPLFLDELRECYTKIEKKQDEIKKQKDVGAISQSQYIQMCKPIEKECRQLLLRMSKMKFFDPACGSGNFLIITYKMLRLLEMDILSVIAKCSPQMSLQFIDGSVISIQQFYGIELLDFPHEVAMLSLWLAEHQMNKKMREDFGVNTNALPLKDITNIKCGNACRVDWNVVCPHSKEEEVFVFGNPPYLGSRRQDVSQKLDMEKVFHTNFGELDYIACWFMLGAKYVKHTSAQYSFVSTNSICQGLQVSLIWKRILNDGLVIKYAYQSFKWQNNAKYNAAVICVIVCVADASKANKRILYNGSQAKLVKNISPLLMDGPTVYVENLNSPICEYFPTMNFGNMPADGGKLILSTEEKNEIINEYPIAEKFIRPLVGAEDFINGKQRWCIWLYNANEPEYRKVPEFVKRIEELRDIRLESSRPQLASIPHLFAQITQPMDTSIILIPRATSERREYVPMGFLEATNIAADSCMVVGTEEMLVFGILNSIIHMLWMKTVGGKLKTDYRYSAGLCYNTFPFPRISSTKKQEIEDAATDVLMAREPYLTVGKTLADLYDPDKMPDDLREAHHRLDDIVESCYPGYPFATDEARLECLFKMYEKMTKK